MQNVEMARSPKWLRPMIDGLEERRGIDKVALPLQRKLRELFESPTGRSAAALLRGNWLGHPLHPAVTDIPIGSWTAACLFDLGANLWDDPSLERAAEAAVGVGIFGAVLSAVTGVADWATTTDRQRRVGLVHANLNSIALVLQIASLVRRKRGMPGGPALSAASLAIGGVSAYLGGELVYRMATRVGVRRT